VKVPALEARVKQAPGHLDRCWLSVPDKRRLREVAPDEIGLAAPAHPPEPEPEPAGDPA
jgi:hypothetical protein